MFTSMGQPSSLTSYDSAPGSLLTGLADSVINSAAGTGGGLSFHVSRSNGGSEGHLGRLFIGNSQSVDVPDSRSKLISGATTSVSAGTENHMARHDSSPPGFFSHLLIDHGAPANREPQLRLSGNRSFPQVQENGSMSDKADHEHVGPSNYMSNGFTISSWDEHSDSINFATSPGKRIKSIDGDMMTAYADMDSQFDLPKSSVEMGQYEKFFQLQQDQVPFKVRAKRGCATHPRSIAERERRTRISEKLRKLQDLVPNMEKQTSTADMLDLAVQHIKDLQTQIQVLSRERESCTCKSKR
ncbi:Basic helix-loop-helix (BHLH) DNA-binding superfamily [Rhynchospora pubera]|uniref:Basic helix-loop-helix (BHLH) DNA-binding superfamily n=1 Tax=Rhynchospora pubera TaxID=906938 RepID=A0AAV8FUQ6_9POAL|nr:Basic helix-loop-helix (BHLH) DNA-binding superfamily [Rhynchospora pubera]